MNDRDTRINIEKEYNYKGYPYHEYEIKLSQTQTSSTKFEGRVEDEE